MSNKSMTVKDLREYLGQLPDDMLVVMPTSDHHYEVARNISVEPSEIKRQGGKVLWLCEYYDEGNRSQKTTKIQDVLVIS